MTRRALPSTAAVGSTRARRRVRDGACGVVAGKLTQKISHNSSGIAYSSGLDRGLQKGKSVSEEEIKLMGSDIEDDMSPFPASYAGVIYREQ